MPDARNRALRLAVAGAVLVVLAAFAARYAWLFAADPIERLAHQRAARELTEASGGVYRLSTGRLRIRLLSRRATFDSLTLTTDSAINAARPVPLPPLDVTLRDCAIEGIVLHRLIRRRGLYAGRFDCRSVILRPSEVTLVTVAGLRLGLADSALAIGRVTWSPTISDDSLARRSPFRRDRVRMSAERIAASGFDYDGFLREGSVRARTVAVDSFTAEVRSDRRRPQNPRRTMRLTPQAWAARRASIVIDSMIVRGARVEYRERQRGHARDAVLLFDRIDAIATGARHIGGRSSLADTLRLDVTARLFGAARLEAHFDVPLDAPRFDMAFSGRLGAMDAVVFNEVFEQVQPFRVAGGRLESITFAARVVDGRALGTLTPLYRGFAVEVTGRGDDGIVARGGVVGRFARRVATWAANRTRVYRDNPETGLPPRVGRIDYRFVPDQKLPKFLWFSLRGALLPVILR